VDFFFLSSFFVCDRLMFFFPFLARSVFEFGVATNCFASPCRLVLFCPVSGFVSFTPWREVFGVLRWHKVSAFFFFFLKCPLFYCESWWHTKKGGIFPPPFFFEIPLFVPLTPSGRTPLLLNDCPFSPQGNRPPPLAPNTSLLRTPFISQKTEFARSVCPHQIFPNLFSQALERNYLLHMTYANFFPSATLFPPPHQVLRSETNGRILSPPTFPNVLHQPRPLPAVEKNSSLDPRPGRAPFFYVLQVLFSHQAAP